MANLKDIIYISNEDYETLVTSGTVTINGSTLTYDEDNLYITPEKLASTTEDGLMSSSDKIRLNAMADEATKVQASSNNGKIFINGTETIVYDDSSLRALAEGKTRTYVVDALTNITGTKGTDDQYTNVTAITGVTIANLKIGDTILVKATEVPDYWVSALNKTGDVTTSVSLNKMETTKVDVKYNTAGGDDFKPTGNQKLFLVGMKDQTTNSGYATTYTNEKVYIGADNKLYSNGNEVLTSHQDISGKAPNNHASTATTYGIGTSDNYGHVKLGAANQNGATAENGIAAPNGHTHSQYVTSSGVTSVGVSGTGLKTVINSSEGTTAISATGSIKIDSSSAGDAAANKVVLRNAAGSIQSEKFAVSSGTTTQATMQYNSSTGCLEIVC